MIKRCLNINIEKDQLMEMPAIQLYAESVVRLAIIPYRIN